MCIVTAHKHLKCSLHQVVGCIQSVHRVFEVSLQDGVHWLWCKKGTAHPGVDHPTEWHPNGAHPGPNLNQILKNIKTYTFYHCATCHQNSYVAGQILAFGWCLSASAHLHMPPLQCTLIYRTGRYVHWKNVFGQHLTEPKASNMPCSFVYKQTTIQGQIGPKPKKTPREHFDRPGGGIYTSIYSTYTI